MKKIVDDKISLGVCYYPEHWDEGLWQEDLERMLANGIHTVRIAEFAWSKFEPTEGNFTYAFFDGFLEVAKAVGMQVIFCTPTATPPAWLTKRYPEVLNTTLEGVVYQHGARRHYNYNAPKYIELTERIVGKIAAHYAKHESIVGWQIDNEINCQVDTFYAESDTIAFRKFLEIKYGSLEVLNQAWGTVFWNQDYTAWDEIYVPRSVPSDSPNPHMMLDYYRFISDSASKYVKLQSDILKKYIKEGDFITTNGIFGNLDNHKMTADSLDYIMYDSYPNFAYCLGNDPKASTDLNDRKWSKNLAEVRSISPVFGIMEQQSGPNGWNTTMEAPAPKPGQMTLWTMQSIAHGADYVSYFRWRTCTVGTEIYWHGILDYSNRDNRRLNEVKAIYDKVQSIADVTGGVYEARVGILKDYDNIWDAQLDAWHRRVEQASQKGLFEAMQLTHTPFDYIYLQEGMDVSKLTKYDVLFYPHALILTEEQVKVLTAYVEAGGKLILGCRTGQKDSTGRCVMMKLPGLLQPLTRADVTEYSFISPADDKIMLDWEGTALEASVFTDLLQPLGGAQSVGTYTSTEYKGVPALIKREVGEGEVYYYGSTFTRETAKVFLSKLGIQSPYQNLIEVPECCELAVRTNENGKFLFVLNYSKEEVKLVLKEELVDVYTGNTCKGKQALAPYGTCVYKYA